jgi:hypothetical protein
VASHRGSGGGGGHWIHGIHIHRVASISDEHLVDEAKIGVLAGSVLATLLAAGILRLSGRSQIPSIPAPSHDHQDEQKRGDG